MNTKAKPESHVSEAPQIAAVTMVGDLMQLVIDELKAAPDVWQKLGEPWQQDVIDRTRQRVEDAVRQCVHIIASDHRPTIVATVESVTVKDGIKAVLTLLTLPKSDSQRHELFDSAGRSCLIVVGGAEDYAGGAEQVKPDPEQPALPIPSISGGRLS